MSPIVFSQQTQSSRTHSAPHKVSTVITRSPVGHTMPPIKCSQSLHSVQSDTQCPIVFSHYTQSSRTRTALPTTCSHKPHQSQSGRHTQAPLLHRYQELPIPERITSDAYIHRLLGPTHSVKHEVDTISHYDEPGKRIMGKLGSLLSRNMTATTKKNEWRVLAVAKKVD